MARKLAKKKSKGRICGIYIRCSTMKQTEKESLSYQERECRKFIETNNLAFYKIYQDVISGTTRHSKRPGMTAMFKDIEAGYIDAVVVHCLDRMARGLDTSGEINCFYTDHNVTVYQCKSDVDDTTVRGKAHLNVQRFIGQMELDAIKERTILGRNSKMLRCGWVGGRIPFGYTKDLEDKDAIPVINPEEAETVKLIYRLYWSERGKLVSVVRYLNKNNIPTGRYNQSKKWSNSNVMRILSDHHDKYKGGLINENESNICWEKILDIEYGVYPKSKIMDDLE